MFQSGERIPETLVPFLCGFAMSCHVEWPANQYHMFLLLISLLGLD